MCADDARTTALEWFGEQVSENGPLFLRIATSFTFGPRLGVVAPAPVA